MVAAQGGLSDLLEKYLLRIFNGDQALVDRAVAGLNFNSLNSAIEQQLGALASMTAGTAEYRMALGLRSNAALLSVFKSHSEKGELVKLLTDANGERRSWSEFKKLAAPITETYNKTWLETEFNQAMSNAEMAGKWLGFEASKEQYPNLQYRAVMDQRTRETHAKLNGLIAPISDPVWRTIYPPNGWGCRCSVTQTDKKPNKPDGFGEVTPDKGFDFNPGIERKLFADSAGYYQGVGKADKTALKKAAKQLLKGD